MKLTEWEGKELLRSHGIAVPRGELIEMAKPSTTLSFPLILKSQVRASNRKAKGGIVEVKQAGDFAAAVAALFALPIDGIRPETLLAEERVSARQELYCSFSYSTELRAPVLALNPAGGSGVDEASITPLDILADPLAADFAPALAKAGIEPTVQLQAALSRMWQLFVGEKLLLLETNPLFITTAGDVVAGDAKVIRDSNLFPQERPYVSMRGDIGVIASGGGASMLAMDMLLRVGGKPANYAEYSGNPPASVVEELTIRILSRPGLRGAWVVGGTANFTDIFETLTGFVAGLRNIHPKPAYPIVIRREGPRQKEAQEMLERVAKEGGFRLYALGSELSMADSATFLLEKMKRL